jgi:hypothetical protein
MRISQPKASLKPQASKGDLSTSEIRLTLKFSLEALKTSLWD